MLTRAKKSNQNQIIGGQTASRKSTMTVMRISIPFVLQKRAITHPAHTPLINEKNWPVCNQNVAVNYVSFFASSWLGTIHILRQQKIGWVCLENGQFCLRSVMYLCCGWVRKSSNLCGRNLWRVPCYVT